ncbi:MAG: penicillin-binding protein, partial [Rhodothermales bacterium]|nr:penicillin-binding protein [Rhodothermales bacterium]
DLDFEPWTQYCRSQPYILNQTIRETDRYRSMIRSGTSGSDAVAQLRENQAFMDSLKAVKTRLELGFVAIDPGTGHVRTWIGGTDLEQDWYDHVSIAKRQPGSTFKPFVYTAAIDEGWSPYYALLDDTLNYVDQRGEVWSPGNSGGFSGQEVTLREGLAQSLNSITARLMIEVGPSHVAFYARRMGIKSPLNEVPALALGTSDVTLLEMTTAYSTFANGGLLYEPVVITQIQDRSGNILYESESVPREALSEATAYKMIDMMRAVVQPGPGHTGQRIRTQYGLWDYDFAGKTGTTQYSADNWFMLMHPDLVVGSWVGFNDPRFRFRTDYWGQGAHTALHLVGDFMVRLKNADETYIARESRFPSPQLFGAEYATEPNPVADSIRSRGRGGVAW